MFPIAAARYTYYAIGLAFHILLLFNPSMVGEALGSSSSGNQEEVLGAFLLQTVTAFVVARSLLYSLVTPGYLYSRVRSGRTRVKRRDFCIFDAAFATNVVGMDTLGVVLEGRQFVLSMGNWDFFA